MKYNLHRFVIKPILKCTANCPTCSLRMNLYSKRLTDKMLLIEDWKRVLYEISELDCKQCNISGGEPLLYNDLIDLINIAKSLDMRINLNTNGGLLTPEMIGKLIHSNVDTIRISIYSLLPEIHDDMRHEPGLLMRAKSAITYLQEFHPGHLDLETIITRRNIFELPNILRYAFSKKVGYLYVAYLEGDFEKKYLPTLDQIIKFRSRIIPELKEIIDKMSLDKYKLEALSTIENIFTPNADAWINFSTGEYHPSGNSNCNRSHYFTIILANGEVHPCNGVEYFHKPIMGNVFNKSFKEIWTSKKWDNFRVHRHKLCRWCPMTLHFRIPIMGY
ncbi:radical SAM protein [Candidatus Harpocratesius sp.]